MYIFIADVIENQLLGVAVRFYLKVSSKTSRFCNSRRCTTTLKSLFCLMSSSTSS